MQGVVLLALAVTLVIVAGEERYGGDRSFVKKTFRISNKSHGKDSPHLREGKSHGKEDSYEGQWWWDSPHSRTEKPYVAHEDDPYLPHSDKDEKARAPTYVQPASGYLSARALSKQLDELSEDVGQVAADLTQAATVCAISEEQLNQISGFFVPKSQLIVKQQGEVIADFEAQATVLRKEVDLAKGYLSSSMSLAESTHAELQRQISDYLNGSKLEWVNKLQDEEIEQLKEDLMQEKDSFLMQLKQLLWDFLTLHTESGVKIARLDRFVASRRCETGFISVGLNQSTTVYFQTPFSRNPNVTLSFSGFSSDRHVYSHGEKKDLAVKKEVTAVYPNYFVLEVQDLSQGKVRGIYAGCRWVACQNIEGTFLNLHEGGPGRDDVIL